MVRFDTIMCYGGYISIRCIISESEDDNYHKRYSIDLETPERRRTFAQRLREALKKEEEAALPSSDSEESSYAVGISVAGSGVADCDIK